jgi:hypothetical protein
MLERDSCWNTCCWLASAVFIISEVPGRIGVGGMCVDSGEKDPCTEPVGSMVNVWVEDTLNNFWGLKEWKRWLEFSWISRRWGGGDKELICRWWGSSKSRQGSQTNKSNCQFWKKLTFIIIIPYNPLQP